MSADKSGGAGDRYRFQLVVARLRKLKMPKSPNIDNRSMAPPPDLLGAALLSVTTAVACADNPLAVELHVTPKVSFTDAEVVAKGSVMVWLPLADLVPAQLSPEPPPVAVQPVAFVDAQVRVVDWPAVIEVGDADSVAVTAGQVQTIDTVESTAGSPGAVQCSP
jgi:hypothetical protein